MKKELKQPKYVFHDGEFEIRGYDDYIVVVRFYLVKGKLKKKIESKIKKLK